MIETVCQGGCHGCVYDECLAEVIDCSDTARSAGGEWQGKRRVHRVVEK